MDNTNLILTKNNSDDPSDDWSLFLQFISSLTRTYYIGTNDTRIGVVIISNKTRLAIPLKAYNSGPELRKAILGLNYTAGFGNLTDGLKKQELDVSRKELGIDKMQEM